MIAAGGVISAGTGVGLIARVVGALGVPVTQATITSIAYTVTNLTTGLSVGTGTFTVASVVYNTLQQVQTDPRWPFDSPTNLGKDGLWGWNFLGVLPASLFPPNTSIVVQPAAGLPLSVIQADIAFTPATGELFRQIWTWKMAPVYG